MATQLVPVTEWDWCLYTARYWRDEAHCHSGEAPLLERQFIESDPERFLVGCEEYGPEGGWPMRVFGGPGYVSWEPEEEDVRGRLRFVTGHGMGGTRVDGAGWLTPLPVGWRGI